MTTNTVSVWDEEDHRSKEKPTCACWLVEWIFQVETNAVCLRDTDGRKNAPLNDEVRRAASPGMEDRAWEVHARPERFILEYHLRSAGLTETLGAERPQRAFLVTRHVQEIAPRNGRPERLECAADDHTP